MHWPARVDIAIVNYHSAEDIQGSLDSLGPWNHGSIWLIDNSCDAAQADALWRMAAPRPEVKVLVANENMGFGRGCNLAYAQCNAEYLLLLNPDARIAQQDLRQLLAALEQDPKLAAVSPATYWNTEKTFVLPRPSSQTPGAHVRQIVASWWPWATRIIAQKLVQATQEQMAQTWPVRTDLLAGAVLLLRQSAVQAAGGLFDPGYFMFFEDADLSIRLRRAGYALALLPGAKATHNYRHKPFKAGLMVQSQMRYFELRHRWYFWLTGRLRGMELLARPFNPTAWFEVLGTLPSAQAFCKATRNARVLAFSPSVLMIPAIARPLGHETLGFTPQEWDLLEPGPYAAWIEDANSARRWVYFVRV